jgi:hypothetical protein
LNCERLNCERCGTSIHFFVTEQQKRDQAGRFMTLKQHRRVLVREMPLLVLLFLLTGQFTLASGVVSSRADAPEAVVEITRRDVGEVFAGEEVEYAFIVRNAGTKPLELAEKSTIPSRSANAAHAPAVAMWRPADRIFTPAAAARRAAPS